MKKGSSIVGIGVLGAFSLLLASCGPAAAPEAQEQQPGRPRSRL